jgi:O-antigen/teichoic acid export membrane protein
MMAVPMLSFLRRAFALVRLRPLDTTTSSGRSRERFRRAALSGFASGGAKVVAVLTSLITVPLTLKYLGNERFGMWMAVSSVVALFSFADLGIGNGLVNLVTDAEGRGDHEATQRAISSGFWILAAIATLLLGATAIAYPITPWQSVFRVTSPAAIHEAGPVFVVLISCFAVNLPIGVVSRIESAYQSGFVPNLWSIASNIASLLAILLIIHFHGSVPLLLLAVSGVPVLGVAANGAHLFLLRRPWLLPRIRYFSLTAAKGLVGTGLLFFCIQVAGVLGYQSDNMVIAQIMGAAQVTNYAVAARMFSVIPIVMGMAIAPLWPAYADAIARGDIHWVRSAFRVSLGWCFAVTIIILVVLLAFGQKILLIWVGPQIRVTFALLAAFAARSAMSAYLYPASTLLTGLGKIRTLAVLAMIMAVFNIALSIVLVKLYGTIGAILGTVIAEVVFALLPTYIVVSRSLREMPAME